MSSLGATLSTPLAANVATDLAVLGPYPGNGSVSILKYYRFHRDIVLPGLDGLTSIARLPGGRMDGLVATVADRTQAWWDNYLQWPVTLLNTQAGLSHMVDHGLAWYGRFLPRGRRLVTVHDLIQYLSWQGKLPLPAPGRLGRAILRQNIAEIKRADHLIAVSQHTADCLVRELDIPAGRITVVHNPSAPAFRPLTAIERTAARQRFFANAEHAVIHVGKPSPYKNRSGVLRAFALLHRELPGARLSLVHGAPTADEAAFLRESSCAGNVHFLPPLREDDLRLFYGAADVLLFPSLYEGFGWPPLEAMACGCPVVTSNRASLPEVVGGAAITVDDPHDYNAIATAARRVLQEPRAAAELQSLGLAQAARFAPARVAQQITAVYHSLLR